MAQLTDWDEVWGFVWQMEKGLKLTAREVGELAWLLKRCEDAQKSKAIQAYMEKVLERRDGKPRISTQEIMKRRLKYERALE